MGAVCGGRPRMSIVEKYDSLCIEYSRVVNVVNEHLFTIQQQSNTIHQLRVIIDMQKRELNDG
jgi:hypothetical protein